MKRIITFIFLIIFCSCTQYNETESIQLAAYSLASYCRNDNLNPYDCGKICERSGDLQDIQFIQSKEQNLFGFVGYQPEKNEILFVFRGSILTDKHNIQIDLDIVMKDYEFCHGCQVAGGLIFGYETLKEQTNRLFIEYRQRYPNSIVVATGHSLGAALATYFAIDIYHKFNYHLDFLYTFGSPRLGNEEFVNYYNSIVNIETHFRVVKARDNIVRYPFKELGFRHVGQLIYYDSQDNVFVCQSEFDPQCDQYYYWDWSFEDHQKYVKCSFSEFRGDKKCTGRKPVSMNFLSSKINNNFDNFFGF